jgi:hypothetical protein
VRQVGVHVAGSERRAELLGATAAVDEHQPFLPAVQPGDDGRGVLHRADVVELDIAAGRVAGRCDDPAGGPIGRRPLQPGHQLIRIADGRRQADALDRPIGDLRDALQNMQQVPATVISRKRVDLVDDDGADIGEEASGVDSGRDEDSSDSGVVSRMSGRVSRVCRRAACPTSPCQ